MTLTFRAEYLHGFHSEVPWVREMTSRLLESMWSLQAGVEGTLFHVQSQQLRGFPGGAVIKNPPAMQETQEAWVLTLGGEVPLEEEMQPTPVFLPGKFHGQRSLVGCSRWGHTELVVIQQL